MRLRPPFNYDDVMWFVVLLLLAGMALAASVGCGSAFGPSQGLPHLGSVSGNYPNEMAACIDEAGDWTVPATTSAGRTHVSTQVCPDGTRAIWHAHPVRILDQPGTRFQMWLKDVGKEVRPDHPEDLCYLSPPDMDYALQQSDSIPALKYTVVGVDEETWCWWTIDQVRQARYEEAVRYLDPIPGQHSWPRQREVS